MFSKIIECPKCGKRFRQDLEGEPPATLTCPHCGTTQPYADFYALILCSQCHTKLGIPLDVTDMTGLSCPKCGAEIKNSDELDTEENALYSTFTGDHHIARRLLKDGEIFDKYRIIRLLGSGGMAEVYLAEHLLIKQPCALKLMRGNINSGDPIFVKRFIREAKLAHKFNHPNIVRVYDAGSDSKTGYLFIAMEYVEGKTLLKLLDEGRLSEEVLKGILVAMTEALKVLAAANVVHRDIKPSNIMLTGDGTYKLMDLGIAKYESEQQGEMTLTMDQSAIGTPGYASPEQCRSAHDVDIRSDIYCLGATLYHLASGVPPFTGNTPLEIILNVLQTEPVPLKKYRPDLSAKMLRIIDSMMKKNPAERPADPEALENMIAGRFRFDFGKALKAVLHIPVLLLRYWALICVVAILGYVAYLFIVNSGRTPAAPLPEEKTTDRQPAPAPEKPMESPVKLLKTMFNAIAPPPPPDVRNVPANSGSIETRIEHAERRRRELVEALAGGSGDRKLLNDKLKIRTEQLRRLKEQLAVRERAKHPDRSKFDAVRMGNFKRKYAEYTRGNFDYVNKIDKSR